MVGNMSRKSFLVCLFVLIVGIMYAGHQPSIRLSIMNEDGIALKQVAVGKPFILELSIEGIRNNSTPFIRGLDDFTVEKQSMRMTVINGASTILHRYSVIIDEPGTYRLGPAEIDDAGTVHRSSSIVVSVGDEVVEDVVAATAGRRKEPAKKALLQVSCDKNKIVVGEKFTCYVRFLFHHRDISLQHIQVPEFDFIEEKKSGPKSGKQVIDGVTYDYLEWEWELVARDVGRKRIAGFTADYIQQKQDDDIMGNFHRMFRGFVDKKRIHANPITIVVEALPDFDHEVKAVGSFSNLRASVDSGVVREGEGLVLALELEGSGNLNMLDSIPLTALPQGFKAYPSKSYVVPGQQNKKRFEYILQAMQKGAWEIPAQELYYFDVSQRTYKKLTSEPISVNILPGQSKQKYVQSEALDVPITVTAENNSAAQELAPLCAEYFYRTPAQWRLPWWLFFLFVVIPLAYVLYVLFLPLLSEFLAKRIPSIKKRAIRVRLRKKLESAQKQHNFDMMYEVFISLFAHYADKQPDEITQDFMETMLSDHGFTRDQQAAWHLFWNHVNAVRFAREKNKQDISLLYKQADAWFAMLEQRFSKDRV